MFYGKYFYRAELYVPAAWMMRNIGKKTREEFSVYVDGVKKKAEAERAAASYWTQRVKQEKIDSNSDMIYDLYQACQLHKGEIQTRLEGSKFRIFTKTSQELFDIFDYCPKFAKECLSYIYQPASLDAATSLSNDVIFVQNPKFPYRVMIREGSYDAVLKQQILNYINNYPGVIHVSRSIDYYLSDSATRYLAGYYHVRELECLTFLRLIAPRFVGKIYRVERA